MIEKETINLAKTEVKEILVEEEEQHKKSRKHDFLLSAKNLYLTYSNCDLELIKIIEILKEKLSSYVVQDWVVVREYHETGEAHVHIYLKLLKKAIIKSATFLDMKQYHGNYQGARKPNNTIEYMLKSIPSKNDPNLYYSPGMSNLIGELGNYKSLSEALLDLAENGEILQAMNLLRKESPDMYLKQGAKIEKRLIEIHKDKHLENQREYDISEFYLSYEMSKQLVDYIQLRKKGENPVLAIVG